MIQEYIPITIYIPMSIVHDLFKKGYIDYDNDIYHITPKMDDVTTEFFQNLANLG